MYIIIFIIILAVLVFVHELGHFIFAKAAGIKVDEFAIGFPPRIASFTKGETRYALNLLPLGGYVKIFGEDYEEAQAVEVSESPDKGRSFAHKPRYVQAMVLLAGITFNIIFAWILLSIGFMSGMAVPEGYNGPGIIKDTATTITSVVKKSPADVAGMKPGDKILALSAPDQTVTKPLTEDTQKFTSNHNNQPITVTYERSGKQATLSVTPTVRDSDHATIGITTDELGILKLGFFSAFWEGAKLTVNLVKATAVGIVQFLGTAIIGKAHVSDVTGPVGIASLVNDATQLGFGYLISFTAFISINLAIINLIPFPALDGGRVLFVIIEKIRGKALNPKAVQIINTTGLGLLLLLMLVVTVHDVINLF